MTFNVSGEYESYGDNSEKEYITVEAREIDDEEEDENHQSYKFKYDNLLKKYEEIYDDYNTLLLDKQNCDKEIVDLIDERDKLKAINDRLNKSSLEMMDNLKKYISQGIYVTNINTDVSNTEQLNINSIMNNISETPGIYGGNRPSFYTALPHELSKANIRKKNTANTVSVLKDCINFWKSNRNKEPEQIMNEYDMKRKQYVIDILKSNCSNEEKYIKYFLITPGIDMEYMKTLQGAANLNINANIVITLLEQPYDMYNKDVIELYISEVQKSTEYNLKQELAEELIEGKWYITADVNGSEKKFQLVPMDEIEDIRIRLNSICDILSGATKNDSDLAQNKDSDISDDNMDVN